MHDLTLLVVIWVGEVLLSALELAPETMFWLIFTEPVPSCVPISSETEKNTLNTRTVLKSILQNEEKLDAYRGNVSEECILEAQTDLFLDITGLMRQHICWWIIKTLDMRRWW